MTRSKAISWPTKKLGEIAKVFAGSSAPQDKKYFDDGKYPFFRVFDLSGQKNSNLVHSRDYVNDLAVKDLRLTKAKRGSIVFPKSGAAILTNSRAILGVDGYVVSHLAVVEADEHQTLSSWLYLFLCNFDMASLVNDQSYPSLRLSEVEKIKIPLPPIREQKRIVAKIEKIFQKIDQAQRLRAESLSVSSALLPSAMHQIFSGAGKEGWEEIELGEIAETKMGGTPRTHITDFWSNGEIVWITPEDLQKDEINNISDSRRKISRIALTRGRAKIFPKDTVFVTTTATIGKIGIAKVEMSANQQITGIICSKKLIPRFLAYYFLYFGEKNLRIIGGTAVATHINQTNFRKIKIPLPPLAEQRKIVAHLDSLSAKASELQTLQQSTAADFSALLQSILAKAFAGVL